MTYSKFPELIKLPHEYHFRFLIQKDRFLRKPLKSVVSVKGSVIHHTDKTLFIQVTESIKLNHPDDGSKILQVLGPTLFNGQIIEREPFETPELPMMVDFLSVGHPSFNESDFFIQVDYAEDKGFGMGGYHSNDDLDFFIF